MYGLVPGLLIPVVLWFCFASPLSLSLVKIDALTHILGSASYREWRLTANDGARVVVVAKLADGREVQEFTAQQIPQVLASRWSPVTIFHWVLVTSLVLGVCGYAGVWFLLRRLGRDKQENKRIRGAKDLVTVKELTRMVRKAGAGPYRVAGVPLPKAAPMMGIAAIGAQGSGKSIAIHDLMVQVFNRRKKCFIYDQSGEFYKAHFRPGKDYFFNPALIGSVPWSLPSELNYEYDSDSMGRAFLPPRTDGAGGAQTFFEDAARSLFSVILLRLRQRGAKYTADIAKAFLDMPEEEMAMLIEKSIASSAIDGDSRAQRQGVISSIAIYLNGIQAVQRGVWTIREFLNGPEDSRLFIVNTEDTRAMFAPLFRLMLAAAFSAVESKGEIVHEDRFWFFLDEIHNIGDIRAEEKLALLRKFGVCIVAGLQSDKQLAVSVGADRTDVMMNGFNTALMLRVQDNKLQERMAYRVGEVDELAVNQNQQLALVTTRDGGGLNQVDRKKFVVLPSEFGYLDTNTGFLKLVGSLPAARVDYRHWLPAKPGQRAHIDMWKERQELPERDQSFLIHVEANEDAFQAVRNDFEERKAQAAEMEAQRQAEAAEIEAANEAPAFVWHVTRLDVDASNEPGTSAGAQASPPASAAVTASSPATDAAPAAPKLNF
ncbi:type IV secretion system protein VirD4 [Pelomonas sp. HMWF004]|nr:type IV secretion system protein VirD4 [Pelomonas sp. HMWF004]